MVGLETPKVSAICCTVCSPTSYMARACLTFVGVILNFGPTLPATRTGSCQPVTSPLDNQIVLELRNGCQHMKNNRPPAVVVSIPWDRATSPTP